MHNGMNRRFNGLLVLLFCCIACQAQTEVKSFEIKPISSPGVVGELYVPTKQQSTMAAIVLGGSSGRINRNYSERLAAAGIPSLSLAYFAADGLPDSLDDVPVETVSRAIDYLELQLPGKTTSFGVLGVSRGSELAFLAATVDPRIEAVVGIVPTSVAWHGQNSPHAWSVAGKPVPSLSFDRGSAVPIHQRAEQALKTSDAALAFLPFEKINAAILLVSATDDQIWPSTLMAEQIITCLSEHNFQHPIEHLQLDDNHFIGTANTDVFEPVLIAHFKH